MISTKSRYLSFCAEWWIKTFLAPYLLPLSFSSELKIIDHIWSYLYLALIFHLDHNFFWFVFNQKSMTYLRWAIWKVYPGLRLAVPGTKHSCCGGTWPSPWCFSRAWRARCAPWARIGTLFVLLRWGWAASWGSSLGWCYSCWGRTVARTPTRWRKLYSWWTWGTLGEEILFRRAKFFVKEQHIKFYKDEQSHIKTYIMNYFLTLLEYYLKNTSVD